MKLNRVHRDEWLTATAGFALVVALFLPWSAGRSAFESMSVTAVILLLAAVFALILPVVVGMSPNTKVPIIYESFLTVVASLALLLVAVRLLWHSGDGLDLGAWLALAASLTACAWAWESVSRGG